MDALDRMFTSLIRTLRSKFPELLGNPFEVAELYQTIIPYRHYRRELGLESNADYELTLMALLSGARGYLVGEGRMQETLRAALASPNPDTTLFRSFATSRVAVATDALRRFDQTGESGAEQQPPLGSESARSTSSPRLAESAPPAPRSNPAARPDADLPPAYSHPLGRPLYGGSAAASSRSAEPERARESRPEQERSREPRPEPERARESRQEPARETSLESFRASRAESRREARSETRGESFREPAREPAREPKPLTTRASARSSASSPPSPSPAPAHAPPPQAMTNPTPGPARSTTASALGGSCRYCGGTLPDGRRIVFCPHCGQNLTIQHCPACSTELELGWKYCTTCGRSVASA